jgi:uncharacterized protein
MANPLAPVAAPTTLLAALLAATLAAALPARAATTYAPLDCAKAASPSETAICQSYPLGQAEARMATLFGIVTALVGMGQRGDIGDQQKQWIRTRDQCGADTGCLARAYRARIAALSAILDQIAARGPF